jgi:hypothetical protein
MIHRNREKEKHLPSTGSAETSPSDKSSSSSKYNNRYFDYNISTNEPDSSSSSSSLPS